jgi:DNA-binding transcriptional MerR regulator
MSKQEIQNRFTRSLKVGEISKQTDISISTLHYYEKIGLIETPVRNRKGYRLYGQNSLERLDFIKKAKTLGFKMDEIRRIIDESKTGECPCDSVRNIVQTRLREVAKKIEEMNRFHIELTGVVKAWDEKKPCDAIICGLIEEADVKV